MIGDESLDLKYRPARFEEMIGQKLTALILHRMVQSNQVPKALLFSGPSGTGKTTAARIIARSLSVGGELFIEEIDAASNGGVESMRSLIASLQYSTGSSYRVIIIDEAHSLTREAFNALLKTLEEPPNGTIFVLVTTEPEKIPSTVMSRMTEFAFRTVTPAEIHERLVHILQEEKLELSSELLAHLAQSAKGNVRVAVIAMDRVLRADITSVEEYNELSGVSDTAPSIISALLTGNEATFYEELDRQLMTVGNPSYISAQLVRCFRDLLVLRAGGKISSTGPALEVRTELAIRVESDRIHAACRVLWDLKTKIRVSDDPRGNLELSLMLISKVLGTALSPVKLAPVPVVEATPAIPEPTAPRKLTFDELN